MVPGFIPRDLESALGTAAERTFAVGEDSQVLAHCHIKEDGINQPTLLIVHGLEGSSESPYVIGVATKAIAQGMNVIRMNLRNCGGTLHLTPTLYNAGLSCDVIAVAKEIRDKIGATSLFGVGFSLGGNILLKAAGELAEQGPSLFSGVCAVSPSIDLCASVDSLAKGINRIYEWRFLQGLIGKIRAKNQLFPGRFDVERLRTIKTIRQFDDYYTAPDGGYGNADNYYHRASSIHVLNSIRVPTLIITAQDDPIVPFASFNSGLFENANIELVAPKHGGHGGFFSSKLEFLVNKDIADRFWAEHQVVAFCRAKYDSSD